MTLDRKTVERTFMVGGLPRLTKIASVVRPLQATATSTAPAQFKVVVSNTGTTEAVGCTLAPDFPLATLTSYVVGSTRARDAAFNIAAGRREVLTLTIKPKPRYRARGIAVPIRVFCANALAPAAKSRVNIVTLTF